MKSDTNSIKGLVEQVVREAFQSEVDRAFAEIEARAFASLKSEFDKIKAEAKKTAEKLTLQLLQRENVAGISVEFKL